jgi:hypothetical protein
MVNGKRCGREKSVVNNVNILSQYSARRTGENHEHVDVAEVESK